MTELSGAQARGKIILFNPDDDEGIEGLLPLTDRQREALLNMVAYLDWDTRWQRFPLGLETKDLRDAWVSDIKERLMMMIEICSSMINCIENDEDVQNAFSQFIINQINNNSAVQTAINNVYNPVQPGMPLPEHIAEQNLLPSSTGCDENELWGAIVQLIDGMNVNNIDALERNESVGNAAERINLIFSAIPVIETLPVNEGINFLETIWTDDVYEAYVSNDTTSYRDTLKCDLFCIARNNGCNLSIHAVFNYFVSRLDATSFDSFAQFAAYLVTGTWIGTEINDMFYATQTAALFYGNKFFDLFGIRNFQDYLELGKRNPSNDWTIFCDECPPATPNFILQNTFPEFYDNEPVFLYNTSTGGSVWEATSKSFGGVFPISLNITDGTLLICGYLFDVSPSSDSYQHDLCGAGGLVSGSGSGIDGTQRYEKLGFFCSSSGIILTITIEPNPF